MRIDLNIIRLYAEELRKVTGDDEACYLDTLDGETDVLDLIDMALASLRDDETLAEAVKVQEQRLRDRRSRIEARSEAHRRTILSVMNAAGLRKVERPLATVSVRPGTASVRIVSEADVPSQLMRIKEVREPDKAAIRAALMAGEDVPGCALDQGRETISVRVS